MANYDDMNIYEIASIFCSALSEDLIDFEICDIYKGYVKDVKNGKITICVLKKEIDEICE